MADLTTAQKFVTQELTKYDQTAYETVYPEKWAYEGKHHPTEATLALGTKEIATFTQDYVGNAAIYDGMSLDIPMSDYGLTEDRYQANIIVTKAQWSFFDTEMQSLANSNALLPQRDMVAMKMKANDRSIVNRIHQQAVFGDPSRNMSGILNDANVELVSLTVDPYTLSPEDLYDFFLGIITQFQDDTELTQEFTNALAPNKLRAQLLKSNRVSGSDSNPTGLSRLLDSQAGLLSSFDVIPEAKARHLEANGVNPVATNKDRMILGALTDREAIKREYYPINRTSVVPIDSHRVEVLSYAATSEVQYRQPYKFRIYEFNKAPGN